MTVVPFKRHELLSDDISEERVITSSNVHDIIFSADKNSSEGLFILDLESESLFESIPNEKAEPNNDVVTQVASLREPESSYCNSPSESLFFSDSSAASESSQKTITSSESARSKSPWSFAILGGIAASTLVAGLTLVTNVSDVLPYSESVSYDVLSASKGSIIRNKEISVVENTEVRASSAAKMTLVLPSSAVLTGNMSENHEIDAAELDWRLKKAILSMQEGDIISPPGKNAIGYLTSLLSDDPGNEQAQRLMAECLDNLVEESRFYYLAGQMFLARNLLEEVLFIDDQHAKAKTLWDEGEQAGWK